MAKGELPIWHHVPSHEYDVYQEDNPASVYSDNAALDELCEGDPQVKGLLELDVVLEKMAGEEMAKIFDEKENERLENQVSSINSYQSQKFVVTYSHTEQHGSSSYDY